MTKRQKKIGDEFLFRIDILEFSWKCCQTQLDRIKGVQDDFQDDFRSGLLMTKFRQWHIYLYKLRDEELFKG